jgi:hypothetical protein
MKKALLVTTSFLATLSLASPSLASCTFTIAKAVPLYSGKNSSSKTSYTIPGGSKVEIEDDNMNGSWWRLSSYTFRGESRQFSRTRYYIYSKNVESQGNIECKSGEGNSPDTPGTTGR